MQIRQHLETSGYHSGSKVSEEEMEVYLERATEEMLYDPKAPLVSVSLAVSANLSHVGVSVV